MSLVFTLLHIITIAATEIEAQQQKNDLLAAMLKGANVNPDKMGEVNISKHNWNVMGCMIFILCLF